MSEESRESLQNQGYNRMRRIMDLGMGMLWMAMGVFFIAVRYISETLAARYDDPLMKVFGAVCILYGAFRIYRGWKKTGRSAK